MNPPTLSREARDWLLSHIDWHSDNSYVVCRKLNSMPLTPTDPLDAVRARFQPKTRGGLEYEIFAEKGGYLYGMVSGAAVKWRGEGESIGKVAADIYDLLPASPHAGLIAELREAEDRCYHGGMDDTARLFKRAADALEARDKA